MVKFFGLHFKQNQSYFGFKDYLLIIIGMSRYLVEMDQISKDRCRKLDPAFSDTKKFKSSRSARRYSSSRSNERRFWHRFLICFQSRCTESDSDFSEGNELNTLFKLNV